MAKTRAHDGEPQTPQNELADGLPETATSEVPGELAHIGLLAWRNDKIKLLDGALGRGSLFALLTRKVCGHVRLRAWMWR